MQQTEQQHSVVRYRYPRLYIWLKTKKSSERIVEKGDSAENRYFLLFHNLSPLSASLHRKGGGHSFWHTTSDWVIYPSAVLCSLICPTSYILWRKSTNLTCKTPLRKENTIFNMASNSLDKFDFVYKHFLH